MENQANGPAATPAGGEQTHASEQDEREDYVTLAEDGAVDDAVDDDGADGEGDEDERLRESCDRRHR